MKRLCLLYVLIFPLLLSACGGSRAAKRELDLLSRSLSSAEAVCVAANVRAEYEHKTVRFALEYTEDDSGALVTVVAPELISGISARVAKDGTRIEYADLSLDTGSLDSKGLSPMSSIPILMRSLRQGHLDSYCSEGEYTVLRLIPDDDYICTVWFDAAMTPVRAELQSDGRVVIYLEITDWQI